jgi:alkylation response protein AidB-like acyl-CoA dehydrogenase
MTGESEFCEVFFEGVRVPVSQVMGELNEGWAIALDTLSLERGSYTVRRRAEINAPFDDAVVQLALHFAAAGETPPDRIAELIGRSAVSLAALRGQTRATLARLAADQAPDAMDSVDKLVLSEIEQNVFGGLKNLLGHRIGLSDGTHLGLRAAPIARDYLYGRAASIYGGSSQIQLNIVAERLLGLPR